MGLRWTKISQLLDNCQSLENELFDDGIAIRGERSADAVSHDCAEAQAVMTQEAA